MDLILLAVAGVISGSVTGSLQLHHIVEPGQQLWVEWSAWALLILFSWIQGQGARSASTTDEKLLLNPYTTASEPQHGVVSVRLIAGILFLSQLLWVRGGEAIWWATPVVSIAVFVFHHFAGPLKGSRMLARIGVVGSSRVRLLGRQSMSEGKAAWLFYGMMMASSSLLFLSYSAVGTESLWTGVLYAILQVLTLVLLGDHGATDDTITTDHKPRSPSLLHLSAQGFVLWTFYNLFTADPFNLEAWTLGLGLVRSVQLFSILQLATKDTLIGAMTLSTTPLVSMLSTNGVSMMPRILKFGLAIAALCQLISVLPEQAVRRKWLFLLVIPICTLAAIESFSQDQTLTGLANGVTYYGSHPIERLVQKAQDDVQRMVEGQSKTIDEAVANYIRRYGRKPPPGFDRWFALAQKENFVLVDEFDAIMESLEPFWGVDPSLLRSRIDALGDFMLVHIPIKDHKLDNSTHFEIWQAEIIDEWLETHNWLEILPDMTLVVNLFDEPRVAAPLDTVLAAKAKANRKPLPAESQLRGQRPKRPKDVTDIVWYDFGEGQPWQALQSACAIDSPARAETVETPHEPNLVLPFVDNFSASQDVCQNADLHRSQGIITAPTSSSLTHSLVPVFSPSKPSLFNDIVYPSIWYWVKAQVEDYKEKHDPDWSAKDDTLYWTGSATGGYATMDNWQDLQRQRLVLKVTGDSDATPSSNVTLLQKAPGSKIWEPYQTQWRNLSDLFDIRITSATQCTVEACETMLSTFNLLAHDSYNNPNTDPVHATYGSKYVLDMDGNAFSGRFYRLLESKCAVVKQTIFKEWHDGRIVPWVHFIPVSPSADELGEIMRFLTQEEAGKRISRDVASQGRHWAKRTLRMIDMEITFLRIMLEYGRIVSDDRDLMNYA